MSRQEELNALQVLQQRLIFELADNQRKINRLQKEKAKKNDKKDN